MELEMRLAFKLPNPGNVLIPVGNFGQCVLLSVYPRMLNVSYTINSKLSIRLAFMKLALGLLSTSKIEERLLIFLTD